MFPDKKTQETIVLSVGGSLLVPNGGVDTLFLSQLNSFIRKHIKKGRKFFIVVGGGKTARRYRDAGKQVIGELTADDLDWLGIHATRLNAHLLRTIFQDIAHQRIIENYHKRLRNWKESVVIGAGWLPGHSTDYDAVLLAKEYRASVLINLSNIDWVYDKDPQKHKDAKPIERTTWEYFEKIVGKIWEPGINAPFDPVASQLAKKIGLTVIIANGNNFSNLDNILNGHPYKGTMITPLKIDADFFDREYFERQKGEYRLAYTESTLGSFFQTIANWYRALWIKFFLDPKDVLDVGCGTGKLVGTLRRLGIKAYGIDISNYALEKVKPELQPFIKNGDIIKIPFKSESFELVVSFDVLEHLERSNLQRAIKESARVSKKWILHKVYTKENKWITFLHGHDLSHMSVLSHQYWLNLFKYIDNITVVRKGLIKLPSFFESMFLLKKK
ncbi:hypothetical protein A3C23_03045 [Candidatus Roizmanbacteria bacterium RIFCSPHIGHO2_02_FULL_37_13b]|nr:MAG: hypothetical protein A3C23_03045 [Candidatus Roizmanbacteria bacterium RIFCSPHIGHO2_02_FULL_37_13b]